MPAIDRLLADGVFRNFQGGEFTTISSRSYDVVSSFYPRCAIEVFDSNLADRQLALSAAKEALEETRNLSYTERKAILQTAGDQLTFSDAEIEYVVKMMGMPWQSVEFKFDVIQELFAAVIEAVDVRYGDDGDYLVRDIVPGRREVYRPKDGPVVAFYPSNDPTVAPYIMLYAVLTGSVVVSRPSSEEVLSALKIAELLTTNGYPDGALNVLLYDSATEVNQGHRTALLDEAAVAIAFGGDDTITEFKQAADPGAGTNVVGFGKGRANAYVFADADVEAAAESIAEGVVRWPLGCNATKAVRVAPAIYDEFKRVLVAQLADLTVGDPLADETDIGYVHPETVRFLEDRISGRVAATSSDNLVFPDTAHMTLNDGFDLAVASQSEQPVQMQPVVVETDTERSEFMREEYPGYVLGLSAVSEDSLMDNLDLAYYSNGRTPITMSFYTEHPEQKHELIVRTRAHQKFINDATINVDPFLRHQGFDLITELTETESVTVNRPNQPWIGRVLHRVLGSLPR